ALNNKNNEVAVKITDTGSENSDSTDKNTSDPNNKNKKKGIAIYRLELKKMQNEKNEYYVPSTVTSYYSNNISGICRFIEDLDEDKYILNLNVKLKRFIILNIHGIYN